MNPADLVFALIFLPLLGAALSFCTKAFFKKNRLAGVAEYMAAFIGLGLPLLVLFSLFPLVLSGQSYEVVIGNWSSKMGILYRFDGLAWLVNLLGYSVAGGAWIYSLGAGPKGPEFSAMFLIQTAALAATSMTVDLFNLFVCLEVLGIVSYVLVSSSEKPGAFLASFSYLMVSATAMMFFLIGLFGLYQLTGSLSYQGIAEGLARIPQNGGVPATVSLALIVAAVAMRVAVIPLYGWLPDAHALAPHAISAVLSGVLIKTPLFALSRILIIMPGGSDAGRLMGYTGAVTAFVGVVIALSQSDTKRLLAYHSISQIGFIVCAWGAALWEGVSTATGLMLMSAAFLHALYHGLFKGLLFLTIGTTTDLAGERNVYKLRGAASLLKGAGEKIPVTLLCFLTGALAITAIPPLNGYASKAALSYALKGSWQSTLLFASSIGTMASFIKLSRIFWPDKNNTDSKGPLVQMSSLKRIPRPVQIAQILLALLCLGSGLAAAKISFFVIKILGQGASVQQNLPAELYSFENIKKTLLIIFCGIILYLGISTNPGKIMLHFIKTRPREFQGLFVALSLGTLALSLWIFWARGLVF
jgi:formate hydrogenlyase subunit 3/multisubunit Na+/H+ antiporter MnhD subunit